LRPGLKRLGIGIEELERSGKLELWDWYTATLGQKSKEKLAATSTLKAADLSIMAAKLISADSGAPEYLRLWDNCSVLARFNDERAWVEFLGRWDFTPPFGGVNDRLPDVSGRGFKPEAPKFEASFSTAGRPCQLFFRCYEIS
jgi:hypothetical protein